MLWEDARFGFSRGGSRKFRKRGPRPPPRMKTSLSGHAAYSIVGVFVMQSKVKLTFQKHFENTRKKGGAAPSAPPLNPPMFSVVLVHH